ncbi:MULTISPECIES: PLP-dependent aminotransferase family protein [Achromobacter]|uniref:PLP-dependent aminotransferase family protein n=1 Tax=Achromobacter spanius TaxID=217203 RepID=A0ABY8GUQ8_9BURK|nr:MULTISPECIES: PLP-dependent aminotransferase family protein [Achromobacter]WAI82200.1 PLP-dependent aminotransferase family protein [Achromobacter spanius]WEX92288.1 PLP-dependent aminotransferase family protein [Achromobacter sp. SS2-2022]WFP08562.1 PLP-dependent aminotransferase family protein [Achromobacter spanius]
MPTQTPSPNLPADSALLSSPLARGPGALPRQRQLIQRLKQAILAGQLPAGGKLPSSRALSEDLAISRNTVLIAYEQLTAEGYVIADRQGTRVAPLSAPLSAPQSAPLSTAPQPSANRTAQRALPPATATRLSRIVATRAPSDSSLPMTPGTPALTQFPLNAWRRAQDRALHAAPATTLGYGHPIGEPALREAIAQYLRVSRGVHCDASRIIITEGAQGALALCVQLLTNPGDTAWLEDPGYRGAKSAFHGGDLNVVAMRVDADGIVIPEDAWRTQPPRLIQTTPTHQYPTGAVLSVARRLDLLERARRAGAWIIEDDYDSEFRHQGEPIAAMQGLVSDAPVLYVGTFSKTLFPALRLGFLVLPEALAQTALPSVVEMLRGGHRLEQLTLAAFIDNGQFSRHLGRMRRLYRDRQAALREALATHFRVDHEVLGGHSGLHLTVRLPPDMPDQAIVAQARQVGMNPSALSSFAMAPRPEDNGLVIGYGNTSADHFPTMIKRLGDFARQARR